MRILRVLPRLFAGVGVVMLLVASVTYQSERRFVTSALRVGGTVVELERQSSSDGSGSWYPIVQFETESGAPTRFRARVGSNPPSWEVGEAVEVLYLPNDPDSARLAGFFSLYIGTFVTGLLALIFGGIGGTWIMVQRRAAAIEADVRANGRRVQARVTDIEYRTNITVGRRHPWRIVAEWREREGSEPVVFRSANIWTDPTGHVGETVEVLVDRYDPKRYVVDLGFLPASDDTA